MLLAAKLQPRTRACVEEGGVSTWDQKASEVWHDTFLSKPPFSAAPSALEICYFKFKELGGGTPPILYTIGFLKE